MYLVAYVSSAVQLFSDADLEALLKISRVNNQKVGVTGILLYKEGNFIQVLEGPKESVESVLKRIEGDQRHRGVIRLFEQETAERDFGDWSMGFKRLDSVTGEDLLGSNDLLKQSFDRDEFIKNPSKARQLLLSFKKMFR
jgi:hypothetical protein